METEPVLPDDIEQTIPMLRQDVERFVALSLESQKAVSAALPRSLGAGGAAAQQRVVDSVAAALAVSSYEADLLLRPLRFLVAVLVGDPNANRPRYEDLERELQQRGLAEQNTRTLIDLIRTVYDEAASALRHATSARGVLPTLVFASTTAEVRAVLIKESVVTRPEQYEPRVLGVVPIASVHLRLDGGPLNDLFFQVDSDRLAELIDTLLLTKKDLQSLARCVVLAPTASEGNRTPTEIG